MSMSYEMAANRPRSSARVPFAGIGLGLPLGWMGAFWMAVAELCGEGRIGASIYADPCWLPAIAGFIASLFAAPRVLPERLLCHSDAFSVAAATATTVSCLAITETALLRANVPLTRMVCAVLAGAALGVLVLSWAGELTRLEPDDLEPFVSVSVVTSVTLPLIAGLNAPAGLAVSLLAAPLSAASLALWRRRSVAHAYTEETTGTSGTQEAAGTRGIASPTAPDAAATRREALLVMCAGCLSFTFISFAGSAADIASQGLLGFWGKWSSVASVLVGVAIFTGYLFFSARLDPTKMLRVALPALVIAALFYLQGLPACSLAGDMLCSAAKTLFLVPLVHFAALGHRGVAGAVRAMGQGMGGLGMGVMAGNLLAATFNTWAPSAEPAVLSVLAGMLAITIPLADLSDPTNPRMRGDTNGHRNGRADQGNNGIAGIGGESERCNGDGESGVTGDGRLSGTGLTLAEARELAIDRACARLSEAGDLSEREQEVLALLARGRTRPYIREQLCISTNTIATHNRHIYEKLQVHSKQELLDLVEREMQQ